MSTRKGKMTALVIFFLLVLFFAFVLTPLILAPLGIFTGMARGFRDVFVNGFCSRPWFPFFPLWSFTLFFVILWIAVIVWVYKDAERRGMSGVLWALLVFVGNMIGLLIYLIVRQDHVLAESQHTELAGRAEKTTSSGACPACQKTVDKGFAFCPYCGASLQAVCPACGKPADADWKVCPQCGAPLKRDG